MKKPPRAGGLLQSGLIFSAVSFLTGLGNLAFQGVMGRHLKASGDYGITNSALTAIMPLLGLLPSVATFAVAHYIAHFKASDDSAQLQGLLLGCKKFLLRLTVAGSVLAVLVAKPLSHFFHYSESLMLVTLVCALFSLWAALVTALCQGLVVVQAPRAHRISGTVVLRVLFGSFVTAKMAVGGNRRAAPRPSRCWRTSSCFFGGRNCRCTARRSRRGTANLFPIPRGQRGVRRAADYCFTARRPAGDAKAFFSPIPRRDAYAIAPSGSPWHCR
jgi:hypothetical protein